MALHHATMLGRLVGAAGALDALARAAGSLLAGVLVSRVDLVVLLDVQSAIYVGCGILAFLFIRDGRESHRVPDTVARVRFDR